jgi:hypothetical protein
MNGPLSTFSRDEFVQASWLRSVEWQKWPVFMSQPLIPVLIAFFPIWQVACGIVIAGWLWLLVRNRYINYQLMQFGALWVRLKWPVIAVMSLYFGVHRVWDHMILSMLTPLATLPLSMLVPPGQTGLIQKKLWENVGFDPTSDPVRKIPTFDSNWDRDLDQQIDQELQELYNKDDLEDQVPSPDEPLTVEQIRQSLISRNAARKAEPKP